MVMDCARIGAAGLRGAGARLGALRRRPASVRPAQLLQYRQPDSGAEDGRLNSMVLDEFGTPCFECLTHEKAAPLFYYYNRKLSYIRGGLCSRLIHD